MFFRFASVTLLFALGIYWVSIRLSPEDRLAYTRLVTESTDLRTRRALEENPAVQKRQNVQKDIWTQNEESHFQIQSQGSTLTLAQKKDKIEAMEQLQNLHCKTPNSFILLADEGLYNFPSNQFVAEKNCHLFQGDNRIDGNLIHFNLIEETISYDHPVGHIASGNFDFTANTLFWEKGADQLHLIDEVKITQLDQLTLLAEKGTVYLEKFQPIRFVLEGNVRLISSHIENKESFAMADRLIYHPQEETLLFSSDTRVLFWQDEGLALSASEVLIRQNRSVEGRGDVHFTFNLEEKNRMEAFFRQYL